MFQIDEEENFKSRACIKVVGVGGGGGNALKTMYQSHLSGVDFIAANTDVQALEEHEGIGQKIQLGAELTRGLGAGANPEVGRQAAIESCEEMAEALKGADMVFVTAGMGGGTGTGACGVIASIAKRQGALTVGVVTTPFVFEGGRRSRHAQTGIQFLKENVDTLIVIPNQKLLKISESRLSLMEAFEKVDNILLKAVRGISDLIHQRGIINLDFADVKTIMSEKGLALIGVGSASGEGRALRAVQKAASSPLLEDTSFKGARGVIINITGGKNLSLTEVNEIAQFVTESTHPDAEIIFGTAQSADPNEKELSVTVIATGFESEKASLSNKEVKTPSPQAEALNPASQDSVKSVSFQQQEGMVEQLKNQEGKKEGLPSLKPRLSKDILLEKARLYRQQQEASLQLSMDISEKKKISGKPISSSGSDLPFKKTSSFMGLFKKPDKHL